MLDFGDLVRVLDSNTLLTSAFNGKVGIIDEPSAWEDTACEVWFPEKHRTLVLFKHEVEKVEDTRYVRI